MESCEILGLFLSLYCQKHYPEYYDSLPANIDHLLYWKESDVNILDPGIKKWGFKIKKCLFFLLQLWCEKPQNLP